MTSVNNNDKDVIKKKNSKSLLDALAKLKAKRAQIEAEEAQIRAEMAEQVSSAKEEEVELIEKQITLNMETVDRTEKPVGGAAADAQNSTAANTITATVKEVAELIGRGRTCKAAEVSGRKAEDWLSQQLYLIDIDNETGKTKKTKRKVTEEEGYLTKEAAIERCNRYGIPLAFVYETFSYSESHQKFRLAFVTPTKTTDVRVRNVFQTALMTIFPEADIACKDLGRLFFGSNGNVTEIDYNAEICPHNLVSSLVSYIRENDEKNAPRAINKFCQETALNIKNGVPNVCIIDSDSVTAENSEIDEIDGPSIVYIIEQPPKSSKTILFDFNQKSEVVLEGTIAKDNKATSAKYEVKKEKLPPFDYIKNLDVDELKENCMLYQEFMDGETWLYHEELLGLSMNMWRYQGQQTMITEALEKAHEANPEWYQDLYNKTNTVTNCAKQQYEPMRCQNFCRYANECDRNGLNMLAQLKAKRLQVREVEVLEKRDVDDAYKEIADAITEGIEREPKDNRFTLIKAETGIGKTTMLVDMAEKDPTIFDNTILAFNTKKLAKEVYEKLKDSITDIVYVNDIEISDESFRDEYQNLQATGRFKTARNRLMAYQRKLNKEIVLLQNVESAEEEVRNKRKESASIEMHLQAIKMAYSTEKAIICTHKRMTLLKNKNVKRIIIDEDITETIVETITVNKSDIAYASIEAELAKVKTLKAQLTSLCKFIDEARETPNMVHESKMKTMTIDAEEIEKVYDYCKRKKITINGSIVDYLQLKAVISDENGNVSGYKTNDLPVKEIIMLSATANEEILRNLLKDREMEVIDGGLVQHEGKIIWHPGGFSRDYMNKNAKKMSEQLKESHPDIQNIISMKKQNSTFEEEGFNVIAHFGACSGIDKYKGSDLLVVGTPNPHPFQYLLLAHACGVRRSIMVNSDPITYRANGFEFPFRAFNSNSDSKESELTRTIQTYLIAKELHQACGRARTLRENCTVHLYSSYPLSGVELFKAQY